MISPMTPNVTSDCKLRADRVPAATWAVENCGIDLPNSPTITPYKAETVIMPTDSQPSGLSVCTRRARPELDEPNSGPTAPNAATLHAVNVHARPAAKANATPAQMPPIGTSLALCPSTALASRSP